MILRRIIESLRNQDIGTLLAELVVVVVGIFLGLQVDDWNEGRKDRLDEQEFLLRLHEELLNTDELSVRLRQRRLDRVRSLLDAGDVLFKRTDRESLTIEECNAIVWSTAFNITAPGLPSVDELIGTGRMGIIGSSQLRTALVALQQSRSALEAAIAEKTNSSNFRFLPGAFPHLFQLEAYFDDEDGEVSNRGSCDLAEMREDQAFLNQLSANTDGYDAYLRDGVVPWSSQSARVHNMVDEALNIDHEIRDAN